MQIPELYNIFLQFPSIQTDTRKIKEADLFFALKGPHFNGNQFAEQALAKGAAYVIVDEVLTIQHPQIIRVDDVLKTLPSKI